LFLQGTRDELAELARLRRVVRGLGARATLHVVDGADHGFDVLKRSGRTAAEVLNELATSTATWMERVAA
jgi:predicted alpha/beta-hydrolase family hydrolase